MNLSWQDNRKKLTDETVQVYRHSASVYDMCQTILSLILGIHVIFHSLHADGRCAAAKPQEQVNRAQLAGRGFFINEVMRLASENGNTQCCANIL